jgi:hypothetical protein
MNPIEFILVGFKLILLIAIASVFVPIFIDINKNREVIMQERIAPFDATKEQKRWLNKESEKPGNSSASILRGLIQAEINKQPIKEG